MESAVFSVSSLLFSLTHQLGDSWHWIRSVIHYFKLIHRIQPYLVNLPSFLWEREDNKVTELHINIRILQFSFPRKEYSVTGNRRELITNAHRGLKHFSQFNSFSLLMANISNIALISGDLKFPRLPVKYQIYSFLSTLNTLHPCSCYELKIMFCLSSSHPMTPTTTGLHFQFRLCFSPKYYSSNSYKEVQPQIAELSLRFQQGLSNKQYVWLVSERRRIILILLSPSKAWKKNKIWSMCWQ